MLLSIALRQQACKGMFATAAIAVCSQMRMRFYTEPYLKCQTVHHLASKTRFSMSRILHVKCAHLYDMLVLLILNEHVEQVVLTTICQAPLDADHLAHLPPVSSSAADPPLLLLTLMLFLPTHPPPLPRLSTLTCCSTCCCCRCLV